VIRTYLDSCVLIDAWTARKPLARRAMQFLNDPDREYASSAFVKLETLPQATYHNNDIEISFYEAFFDSVKIWADDLVAVSKLAHDEACRCGLSAIDALHVAAAVVCNADEFITTERPSSPIHRTRLIKVITLYN